LEVMPFTDALTVVKPGARLVAMPLAFSVATKVLLESHVTEPDTLALLPSVKVPVAVKVTGVPAGTEGVVGLILIPLISAAETVRLAVAEVMPPDLAVTVVVPAFTPLATPVPLLIVAMVLSAVSHMTWLVISAVVLSV